MEFTIEMGIGGAILLVVGALVIGGIAQFIGDVRLGYEWVLTAIAAFVGALVASEWITAWREFDPVWDGVALVPALIGGLVVGAIVDVVVRYSSGGSLMPGPRAA